MKYRKGFVKITIQKDKEFWEGIVPTNLAKVILAVAGKPELIILEGIKEIKNK